MCRREASSIHQYQRERDVLRGGGLQALLEMSDVQSAQAMVNYYSERPPNVRGRTIYVQFSNHVELKTEQSSQVRPQRIYVIAPAV